MTTNSTTLTAGMPTSIHVIGPAYPAFAQAAVHIRAGMIFHPDRPVELFENGNASFFLVQGNPGQVALDMASESCKHALQLQAAEYEADVKRAAQAIFEQSRRDELAQQVKTIKAEHEKQVRALEKAAEAEIAKLK